MGLEREECPLCLKMANLSYGICFDCFKAEMRRQAKEHESEVLA